MTIGEALLPEFDQETAATRKVLERIPDGGLAWRPHEKSMTMGELAAHLANLLSWTAETIGRDSVDVAPTGAPARRSPLLSSKAEILGAFDRNAAASREAIAGADDETLRAPWTLLAGGKAVFTMPRAAVLRSFIISHAIHHRAQLCLYLRLNGIPLPPIYGPTADEGAG